jgi:WD40 repeat protein
LIYSPDGDYIFSYDWQDWTRSWNSDTGEHLSGEGPNQVCEATLWDAEASSDGRLQAVAAFDGLAYVFRSVNKPEGLPNYVSVLGLKGHEGNVTDQPLPLSGVDFSPDSRYVVTAGNDRMVRIFVVAVDDLMVLARSRLSRGFTIDEGQRYLHLPSYVEE